MLLTIVVFVNENASISEAAGYTTEEQSDVTDYIIGGKSGTEIASIIPNNADRAFGFSNMNSVAYTSWYNKNNDSYVYIYPTSGPKIKYTVQGIRGGVVGTRSGTYAIPQGVQASVTNYVNENGDIQARLKFNRITTANVDTTGMWSPDSTGIYTIY